MPRAFTRIGQGVIENRQLLVITGTTFSRTIYDGTTFDRARFADCRWEDCRFLHFHINPHSKFERCIFSRCKFDRGDTNLSGDFLECRFEDCAFTNTTFQGSRFIRCHFAARFTNIVFWGADAPERQTVVDGCDFTASQFTDSDFRSGIDTSTCTFPKGYDPYWVFPKDKPVANEKR
jgi:uncharacterized protein YjbI with pentapeptide repeats